MNACERYRSDPEAHAPHLEACEECRALTVELERVEAHVAELSLEPRADFHQELTSRLPLAPWEGARYRSWGLVVAVLATLAILTLGAFLAAGVSPIRAAGAVGSSLFPLASPWELATSFSALIAGAPTSFHITIGILFVVVNLVLVVLLRRPPKGYDA